jgi:outer membrane protein assembly factor BamA
MRHLFLLLGLVSFFSFSQETDSTNTKKNPFVILPAISYAPETDLQLGIVGLWTLHGTDTTQQSFQRQSTISPYFLYTLRKQSIAVVNLNYYFRSGRFLTTSVRYYNFPDLYFGIGNANNPDVSESYTNRFFQFEGQYLIPLNDRLFFGVAYDAQSNKILNQKEGGLLKGQSPQGIDGGNLFGFGPSFRYDTRDYTVYPSSGYFISGRVVGTYLGDFSYTSVLIDTRKFIDLKAKRHILAIQFRTQWTFGDDVPFYKLPQLGGDERLRGIKNASLYRDRQLMYLQTEYRRPLFWRFGMVLFAGVGDVASDWNAFKWSEFKYVAGVGGRLALIPEKKLNARLDIGISRGGQKAIYIGVSETF